jgi:hypothetical protein
MRDTFHPPRFISPAYKIFKNQTRKNSSKRFNSCQFPAKTAQKRADFGQFLQIPTPIFRPKTNLPRKRLIFSLQSNPFFGKIELFRQNRKFNKSHLSCRDGPS